MIEALKMKMFGHSGRFISVFAPFAGEVSSIDSIGDSVFAKGTLGPGIAITPDDNQTIVRAPIGGEILLMSDMSHAVIIKTTQNTEILVHVGIGTVALKGKYFRPLVQNGDFIKAGEPILEFDAVSIVKEGYSLKTPIVIPSLGSYSGYELTKQQNILTQDEIIKLIRD